MKRLLFLGVGSALVFTMGGVGPAQADNGPHVSSSVAAGTTNALIADAGAGKCASCHRAHTAKAEFLLLQAQPALCYTCHDGSSATTAVGTGKNALTGGALRGGGFVTAKIGSGLATKTIDATGKAVESSKMIPPAATVAAVTSRHEVDGVTPGTAWGNGAIGSGIGKSLTLECGSCHDPHGNGNYRILKPIPVDSGYAPHVIRPARALVPAVAAVLNADGTVKTAAKAEIPAVAAVMSTDTGIKIPDVPAAVARVYTTANYWLAGDTAVLPDPTASYTGELTGAAGGIGGTTPDGYIANVANWCTTCHTRYLATTKSYKTDSGDTTFMYRHRSDANYKAGAANCITCHVSHGSNATMDGAAAKVGLPGGDPVLGTGVTSTDSRLLRVDNRGTCVMCHNV